MCRVYFLLFILIFPYPMFWKYFYFLSIFYWLCYYSCSIFSSLYPPSFCTSHPPAVFPIPLSSCPWVVHISSLASPFPVLYFTSPLSIFYLLFMLLISCTFSPILSPPPAAENPPCDPFLWFCSCSSCCFVCFCFLGSVVDSYEFVIILLFMVSIFFFFLGKFL